MKKEITKKKHETRLKTKILDEETETEETETERTTHFHTVYTNPNTNIPNITDSSTNENLIQITKIIHTLKASLITQS